MLEIPIRNCRDCGEPLADHEDTICASCEDDRRRRYCRICGDEEVRDEGAACPICERILWLAAEEDWLYDVAAMHGWSIRMTSVAGTGSRYYEATRETSDDGLESVKFRISDHPTAHCSEDYSLAREPGGDDHTREIVERRLAQPRI